MADGSGYFQSCDVSRGCRKTGAQSDGRSSAETWRARSLSGRRGESPLTPTDGTLLRTGRGCAWSWQATRWREQDHWVAGIRTSWWKPSTGAGSRSHVAADSRGKGAGQSVSGAVGMPSFPRWGWALLPGPMGSGTSDLLLR